MASHARVALTVFALASLVGLQVACSDSTIPQPTNVAVAPPVREFPALTKPAEVFVARLPAMPLNARYVFYDDGTFAYQISLAAHDWPGRYTRRDSVLTMDWNAATPGLGAWMSRAIVHGDTLAVKYNVAMQMNDFEDGSYLRASP